MYIYTGTCNEIDINNLGMTVYNFILTATFHVGTLFPGPFSPDPSLFFFYSHVATLYICTHTYSETHNTCMYTMASLADLTLVMTIQILHKLLTCGAKKKDQYLHDLFSLQTYVHRVHNYYNCVLHERKNGFVL